MNTNALELLPPDQAEALVAAETAVPKERAEQLYHHLRDARPEEGIQPLHNLLLSALTGAELALVKRLLGLDPAPLAIDAEAARTPRAARAKK